MDQVDEVKQKTDIVALIGEHVALTKAGRNYKGLCPFHSEKTPSFMVSPELQIYKCFGCGEGGDAFSFLERHEGMDFAEALGFLAGRAGIVLKQVSTRVGGDKDRLYEANLMAAKFYHWLLTNHTSGRRALDYLKGERKLTDETIKTFQIGFAPDKPTLLSDFLTKKKKIREQDLLRAGLVGKGSRGLYDRFGGRVIFPIFDHRGNAVALAGRVLPGGRDDRAKYINSPETPVYSKSNVLFGMNITKGDIKRTKTAVIVEGELDLISPWQRGIKNLVAIKGSALTPGQAKLLSRIAQRIVFALDADFAGDAAARRAIEIVEAEGLEVAVARLKSHKDPDEAVREDPKVFIGAIKEAVGAWDFIVATIFEKYDPTTGEGKARISKEIVPILALVGNKIVQAHYVGEVAGRLGVETEVVAQEVERVEGARKIDYKPVAKQVHQPEKGRRQLLEERLLGLSLALDPSVALKKDNRQLLATPLVKQIIDALADYTKGHKFNLSAFAKDLPPQLVDGFGQIVLSQSEDDEAKLEKEIDVVITELTSLVLKEKRDELARQIARLEREGNKSELSSVMKEFGVITRKITEVQV